MCVCVCVGASSVLKSPDGNWIALQSTKVSHPSLLTRRRSLTSGTLERAPAALAHHEGPGSDGDTRAEPDSSGKDSLHEIHRAIADSSSSERGGDAIGDSELDGNWNWHEPLLALLTKKAEVTQFSPSCKNSIVDVNLNVEEEEPEGAAEQGEEEKPATSLPVRNT